MNDGKVYTTTQRSSRFRLRELLLMVVRVCWEGLPGRAIGRTIC